MDGGLITIVDEHMFAKVSNKLSSVVLANIRSKFDIDREELEVTASQGPSLPAGNRVHPLVGQWVIITSGPHKSYKGVVQEIRNTSATIELQVLFTSSISLHQSFIIPLTLFQADVCALSIGQHIADHFSLGQKRRWWPYLSWIVSHEHHHLDLRMLHHGH